MAKAEPRLELGEIIHSAWFIYAIQLPLYKLHSYFFHGLLGIKTILLMLPNLAQYKRYSRAVPVTLKGAQVTFCISDNAQNRFSIWNMTYVKATQGHQNNWRVDRLRISIVTEWQAYDTWYCYCDMSDIGWENIASLGRLKIYCRPSVNVRTSAMSHFMPCIVNFRVLQFHILLFHALLLGPSFHVMHCQRPQLRYIARIGN